MSIKMRNNSSSSTTPTTNEHNILRENGKNLQNCQCCPYGYHMDLDFVRYCEQLANSTLSDGQRQRRDRRRQRKSMEVMLGLEQYKNWKYSTNNLIDTTFNEENESASLSSQLPSIINYQSHQSSTSNNNVNWLKNGLNNNLNGDETSNFIHDALDDVVDDFERTLKRSNIQNRNHNNENEKVTKTLDDAYYVFDACITKNSGNNNNTNGHQLHQSSGQNNISIIDNEPLLPPSTPSPPPPLPPLPSSQSQSQKVIITTTTNSSNICHCSNSNKNNDISKLTLKNIREQMAISLCRTRDLEEQVKLIPILEIQLNKLKDEKKLLEKQLIDKDKEQSPPPLSPPQNYRDIGIMCNKTITRDVGISVNCENIIKIKTRTIAIGTDEMKMKTIGTQSISQPQPITSSITTQTDDYQNKINKISIGISVKPKTNDIGIMTIPESLKSTPIKHNQSTTMGKYDFIDSPISLKLLDKPSSLSSQVNDTIDASSKKVSPIITTKNQHTQYDSVVMKNISTQKYIDQINRGTQSTAINNNATKQTDTIDLKHFNDIGTSTNKIQMITIGCGGGSDEDDGNKNVSFCDKGMITEQIKTNSVSSCTTINNTMEHLYLHCNCNYCDLCKEKIKNLAKEFTKTTTTTLPPTPSPSSSTTSSESQRSFIPRPKQLTLNNTSNDGSGGSGGNRNKFLRQNTYTVIDDESLPQPPPTSTTTSIIESIISSNRTCPAEAVLRLSSSTTLDNTQTPPPPTSSSSLITHQTTLNNHHNNQNELTINEIDENDVDGDDDDDNDLVEFEEEENKLKNLTIIDTPQSQEFDEQQESQEPSTSQSQQESSQQIQKPNIRSEQISYNQIVKSEQPRIKTIPTKETLSALKVINDSIQKSTINSNHLKNANNIVQKEWFKVSSTDTANPHDVEDYLDCFEEFSNHLLRYIVNLTDSNGNTCMHYAVSHGNFDVVSILLDSKVCNVNQTNNAGYTCVMLVSLAKLKILAHKTVVQRLFQLSDVNLRAKKHNQTALMLAVSHGNIDMVQMLLEAGADINIQDEDGSTALMCSAEHGRIDIVKLLLAQTDCDSTIQDVDGSTALKISLEAGYRDIGVLLYAHEHMSRNNKSPYTSLRRKQQQTSSSSSPNPLMTTSMTSTTTTARSPGSTPQSPLPSMKFSGSHNHHHHHSHHHHHQHSKK